MARWSYHGPIMLLTLRAHVEKTGASSSTRPLTCRTAPRSRSPWSTAVASSTFEDRARLHAAIEQAQDELDRGEGIPAAQFLADLRSRRGG